MADSLREQMLKMGLVSEDQAQAAEPKGRRGGAPREKKGFDAAARRAELAQMDDAQRRAVVGEIEGHLNEGAPGEATDGSERIYFDTRDGRVSYLEISRPAADGLRKGRYGLVETPAGEVKLLTAEAARAVRALDPDWVRLFTG